LLAWNQALAERICSAPLEQLAEGTVTSGAELPAHVAHARSDGYAITDSAGDIVGAVTISGPTLRMPLRQCEAWVDLLVGYAEQITRTLGGRPPQSAVWPTNSVTCVVPP